MTNSSRSDRLAGASQAAAFLEAFVAPKTQWAHLDIAGPSTSGSMATGFSTQTVLNFLISESKKINAVESNEVPQGNLKTKPNDKI